MIDNINNYYNIYDNIINDLKKYNSNFMGNITEINKEENIKFKFIELINLYKKMSLGNNEEEEEKDENEIIENNEDNEDDEDEENYIKNIKRFNPLDNKYESFEIKNLKEIKQFETKYEIQHILILHDRRLLTVQNQMNFEDQKHSLSKFCVYDLTNSTVCDISDNIGSITIEIFQMKDDNITIFLGLNSINYMVICKIKKKSIVIIFECNINSTKHLENGIEDLFISSKVYNINNSFFIERLGGFDVYSYKECKIEKDFYFDLNNITIFNICEINEKEIAIYHKKKGKIYGENAFLKFYDIKGNKKIKTLKLGNHKSGENLLFANKNNIILEFNHKFVLIDPIKRIIKCEINIIANEKIKKMLSLNDKTFLVIFSSGLFQYEFSKNKINYINKKEFQDIDIVKEYPDNQLVIIEGKNQITIYASE